MNIFNLMRDVDQKLWKQNMWRNKNKNNRKMEIVKLCRQYDAGQQPPYKRINKQYITTKNTHSHNHYVKCMCLCYKMNEAISSIMVSIFLDHGFLIAHHQSLSVALSFVYCISMYKLQPLPINESTPQTRHYVAIH